MVGGPANPLGLAILRRIYAQRAVPRGGLADVESIDPVRLWAVDQEEVDLIGVVRSGVGPERVGSCTRGVEPHHTAAKPSRLALRSQEPTSDIDDQVIPMVIAVRNQHAVAARDELREDDRLTALANIDRMPAQVSPVERAANACSHGTPASGRFPRPKCKRAPPCVARCQVGSRVYMDPSPAGWTARPVADVSVACGGGRRCS
jgi:hypothetical protein